MLLLCSALLLPILGGLAIGLLRVKKTSERLLLSEAVTIGTSVLVWVLMLTHTGERFELFPVMKGLSLCFRVEGMGMVFAGLVSILWPFATLYGMEYMHHEEHPNRFFAFYTMSYGVTLAVALSASLFTLYIFFECLTLITLPLVIHKQDAGSAKAGRMYLTFSISGAALAFMALIAVYHTAGTTDFALGGILQGGAAEGKERLLRFMFLLAFIGFGTKAAVFPMYAWLPAASVAPTPVTALLHAVAVVNTGAFAVIRVIYYSFGTDLLAGTPVHYIVLLLACLTVLFGSGMAVKEQHAKRRLAYSTVSNLSYMLVGAALMTPAGMVGGLSHLIIHGMMKITLFYCAGAILVQTGIEYVQDLRGLGRVMPGTCAVFALGAVAMVGIPPLCGFVSKWNLLTAAGATEHWSGIVVIATLIISSVLTAIYLLGPVASMYFRPLEASQASLRGQNRDPGWMMMVPFGFLCGAIIALGIWSEPLIAFLRAVAGGSL